MGGSRLVLSLVLVVMTGCVADTTDPTEEVGAVSAELGSEGWCEAGLARTYSSYNATPRCVVTYNGCTGGEPLVTMSSTASGITCSCACPAPDPLARAPEAGTQPAATLVPTLNGD